MKIMTTDEEIIRQLLPVRPDQCFETLYNRYVNKIYRRCLSMTKNSENAEDFTHDIFLKVFYKLNAFQERSSFSTWLYSITFNYCSDQLRFAKRLSFVPIDKTLVQYIAESDEASLHEERLQFTNRIISSLSADQQTMLRMKYEEGMSIRQIAHFYNITSSAIKMRLKRSREKAYQSMRNTVPR